VLFGFPIFTAAIMLGVIWGAQREIDLTRPEHPLALIAWIAFAVLVVVRTTQGWRGRRAALLTLVGFAGAVLVMAIYFVRRAVL
jgi:ABC-type transport system involved in cytochrome c biogenesis permease subunit